MMPETWGLQKHGPSIRHEEGGESNFKFLKGGEEEKKDSLGERAVECPLPPPD